MNDEENKVTPEEESPDAEQPMTEEQAEDQPAPEEMDQPGQPMETAEVAEAVEQPVPTAEEPVNPVPSQPEPGEQPQAEQAPPQAAPAEEPAAPQPPFTQPPAYQPQQSVWYGQPYGQPPVQPPVPPTQYQPGQYYQTPQYQQPPYQAPYQPYQQPVQAPPQYGYQPVYPYPQYQQGQPPRPKKKMSTGLKVFIVIAAILAGVAIIGFGGYLVYTAANGSGIKTESKNNFEYDAPSSELPGEKDDDSDNQGGDEDDTPEFDDNVTPPDADDPLPEVDVTPNEEGITIDKLRDGEEMTVQEVYEKVVKSTVTVAVTLEKSGQTQNSTGTGIIATSDGYIITNAHVVLNSKSSRVKVTTNDGEEYDAVVVGMDRTTDLAVIKTNDHQFTPAEFGDSEELQIGDMVIAIGNPGGERFSGSMTGGYISGLDRSVGNYSENGMTYIQTDAAINPGNSGGPLVNMYGQVVGINSSKIISEGFEGMGFAIPISKAKDIIDELLSGGYVKGRVRMGITGYDTSNDIRYELSGAPAGFVISAIDDDSSFAGTEAQVGDIIIGVDGETVTCLDEISNQLLKFSPGETITISLYRPSSGEDFEVSITLLEDKGETQQ